MVCLKSFIHAIRRLIVWRPLLVQRLNYPHAVALYHFICAGLRGKAALVPGAGDIHFEEIKAANLSASM